MLGAEMIGAIVQPYDKELHDIVWQYYPDIRDPEMLKEIFLLMADSMPRNLHTLRYYCKVANIVLDYLEPLKVEERAQATKDIGCAEFKRDLLQIELHMRNEKGGDPVNIAFKIEALDEFIKRKKGRVEYCNKEIEQLHKDQVQLAMSFKKLIDHPDGVELKRENEDVARIFKIFWELTSFSPNADGQKSLLMKHPMVDAKTEKELRKYIDETKAEIAQAREKERDPETGYYKNQAVYLRPWRFDKFTSEQAAYLSSGQGLRNSDWLGFGLGFRAGIC